MKVHYIMIIVAMCIAFGCVSMPEPVNENFLADQSKDEETIVKNLETKIVSKKLDIDSTTTNLKNEEHTVKLSQGELSILNKTRCLLLEEQKQAALKDDPAELNSCNGKLSKNDGEIQKQKYHLTFRERTRDNASAIATVKDSELAVLVAELNYEKAKIAKKFVDKKSKEQGKEPKEKSFFSKIFGGSDENDVDIDRYKSYYDRLQSRLSKDQDNQRKAEVRMVQAEKDYNSYIPSGGTSNK